MEKDKPAGTEEVEECIFCNVALKKNESESDEKKNKIIGEDDTFVAFYDIKPDAEYHILVIPKAHRLGVDKLTAADIPFINDMLAFGKRISEKEAGAEKEKAAIYGFHRPPFNTVKHLHMHCLCGSWNKLFSGVSFTNHTFWFISTQNVLADLTRGKVVGKK